MVESDIFTDFISQNYKKSFEEEHPKDKNQE